MGEFNFENEVLQVASFNKDQDEKKIVIESLDTSNFDKWIRNVKRIASSDGIPPDSRRKIWLMLSDKYLQERNINWSKEVEHCFSEQWREENEEIGIQIIKDLHRTGSSICTGPTGFINQAKLKKILLGYVRWNPEVGYCQGFNMLGALILKTMDKNESDSLKVMVYLIEGILPDGYFNESLSGLQIDMAVFRDLMVLKLPRLARHLQKLQGNAVERFPEPPLTNVFNMNWFLTMFCTCLATDCVLRVWDLVLLEGSDMLLRTALAVWNLLEDKILKTQTADDFYSKMGALSAELLNGHLTTTNGLIDRIMKFGSMPDIQKLRDKYRSRRLEEIYYSDEESDDESKTPQGRRGSTGNIISNNKDRLALDVAILKRQYDRLRDRQRKAHVILSAAVSRQTQNSSAAPNILSVNHLLVGKNAILPKKGRVGPLKGAIPPARKIENTNRNINLESRTLKDNSRKRNIILKQDSDSDSPFRKRSDSSSYSEESDGGNSSTSTSLCDEDDTDGDSSLRSKSNYINRNNSKTLQKVQNLATDSQYRFLENSSKELQNIKIDSINNQRDTVPEIKENSIITSITSTSQLSPIADINKYLCNSTISPIKTPNFDYKYNDTTKSKDYSDSDYEQFEGVTNKYFERLNLDRPKYLDLNTSQNINKSFLESDLIKKYKIKNEEKSNVIKKTSIEDTQTDLPKCVHSNQNVNDKTIKYHSISCPEAGKTNFQFTVQSDSVLQIIEENSKILHRILNKSKENSQSLKSIEDSVDSFNISTKFKSDESLQNTNDEEKNEQLKKESQPLKRKHNESEKLKRLSLDLNFEERKSKKLISLSPSPVQNLTYESVTSKDTQEHEALIVDENSDTPDLNIQINSEEDNLTDKSIVTILLNSEEINSDETEIPEKHYEFEEEDDYDRKLEALKLYNDKIIDKLIVSTNEMSKSVEEINILKKDSIGENVSFEKAKDFQKSLTENKIHVTDSDTELKNERLNETSTEVNKTSIEISFDSNSYDIEKKKVFDSILNSPTNSKENKSSTKSLYETSTKYQKPDLNYETSFDLIRKPSNLLYMKEKLTTSSDDNITNRLESIKNTIKSIDNLCQDKRNTSEKTKNFHTFFDAYNPIRKTDLLKRDGFEGGTRSFVRSSSIRRPKIEEKEEHDNRIKRDNLLYDNNKSYVFNSPLRDSTTDKNKFEIRHTTVTSTFYDRFLSQKHEKYIKIDKLDKTYSNEISSILNENGRRGSKSASNSPTRSNSDENKYMPNNCYLNPPDNTEVHIKSCDNILLRLNSINEPKISTLNFSSFKTSFTSNVNFLKRRFSSGDLSSECDDVDVSELPQRGQPPLQQQPISTGGPPNIPPPPAPGVTASQQPQTVPPELSLSFGKQQPPQPPRGVSAPSSPAKSRESLLQRVQSLTGAARDQGASIIGAAVQSATRPTFNKDKCFTLLVLDDQNTDWSKYFRGKRLHGDYDIRVEQAEFKEISVSSNRENGPVVSMAVYRGGTRVTRSFRPDFVIVRQPPRDGPNDFRAIILGLKYGGVPSINSLYSIYQCQDKPWIFAHLLQLQRRLGRDNFPLIDQTFFPNPKELMTWSKFPCVLKAGHCHGGTSTARLENGSALQDATGLVTGSVMNENQCYCTIEPYIDAKFDIHIQKIGTNYKAFMRKSISGNWKTNQGSAMLEQIGMTEKYKSWIDEVSELFGGMEICGVTVIVSKDGKEYIVGASDCTFPLMGDSQEEDRRHIVDLVTSRMQNVCRPPLAKLTSRSSVSSRGGSPSEEGPPPLPPTGPRPIPTGGPPPIPERTSPAVGSIGRLSSRSSISEQPDDGSDKNVTTSSGSRRESQSSTISSNTKGSITKPPQTQSSVVEDAEDTMKNLRKTFAGIFGDM